MRVLISVDFTCVTPIFTVAAVDESGFGLQGRSLPEISAINENSFYFMAHRPPSCLFLHLEDVC